MSAGGVEEVAAGSLEAYENGVKDSRSTRPSAFTRRTQWSHSRIDS
jgi:hypothetical protein